MDISLVVSTRNNLKYLKWSYASIKKHSVGHNVFICYGLDNCTDGTLEWVTSIAVTDPYVSFIINGSSTRVGHTIMYDRIVRELVKTDIAMIFHSDMYLCPNAINSLEKRFSDVTDKLIVSLTRIEPPLHPAGPEKLLMDFGTEPETFNEPYFLEKLDRILSVYDDVTTNGVFAPWAFFVNDFLEIGGHDPLFRPQSKEDSDIFNRLYLNDVKFIQVWDGLVYHLTCRGSRFNPNLTEVGKNSEEWTIQNEKSMRNFIRKWHSVPMHDSRMLPIVKPIYSVGIIAKNCNYDLLYMLEPWCDRIYIEDTMGIIYSHYYGAEQKNTDYNLDDRVSCQLVPNPSQGIIVELDRLTFANTDYQIIQYLSSIVYNNGEPLELTDYELGNLKIKIKDLTEYQKSFIICKSATEYW